MTDADSSWTLAATCRCLTEDLALSPDDCDRPIAELRGRHRVIADFVKKRATTPIGSEPPIRSLQHRTLTIYSLHSGRYRGATWHQRGPGLVWLLAAHWHEQGSADDAYPYFVRLLDAGRLLPTRDDVERVVAARAVTFERALLTQVPEIRAMAIATPGEIQVRVVGGRVRIRVVFENGDEGIVCVAITNRLIPGEMPVPPAWQVQLLAALFPGLPLAEIEYTGEFAGEPRRSDESCYCGLLDPSIPHDTRAGDP